MSRQVSLPTGSEGRMARPVAPGMGRTTAPGGASAQAVFTGKDAARILRGRIWMITIITTISAVLSVGLWFVLNKYCPEFRSINQITCGMPTQIGIPQALMPREEIIALETASHAAGMKSISFLSEVLKRPQVQETKWFKNRGPEDRREDIEDAFSATPIRNTDLILVGMTASTPEEAKLLLDEILEEYRGKITKDTRGGLSVNLKSLEDQRNELEGELKASRATLSSMGAIVAPGWMEGMNTVAAQNMNMFNQEMQRLLAESEQLEIELARIKEDQASLGVSRKVSTFVEQQEPRIINFKNQISALEQQRDGLMESHGSEHREVRLTDELISSTGRQLETLRQELLKRYTELEIKDVQERILENKELLKRYTEQYKLAEAEQRNLEQKKLQYTTAIEDNKRLINRLEELDQRINNIKVQLDEKSVSVRIPYKTSMEPLERSFPLLKMFLPAGILLGLMLSVGLAFLLEFMDDTVKSPSDIGRHLQVPLLGMIPHYDEEDADEICLPKVSAIHPYAVISEYYRQVRTNLLFSAPTSELKTMLVTSCAAGCGKTTTAVNLGITFASENKRVLLVDANFRRPALNELFPAEGSQHGLSNVLVGQASASDVIRQSGIENMDLVDSGPLPPNPSDLLSNKRMRDLFDSQKQHYDYIIVDGPPALVLIDSRIISNLVDGTIVVVHAENTSRGMIQRMVRELRDSKGRILGALLNDVKYRKGGYFEKSHRSYYDYVGIEEGTAQAATAGDKESALPSLS